MEHLSNCHGEWNAFLSILYCLPVLGIYIKAKFQGTNNE